eukprot:scaffold166385_cov32-Tisochrysis_lutea.AAC.1
MARHLCKPVGKAYPYQHRTLALQERSTSDTNRPVLRKATVQTEDCLEERLSSLEEKVALLTSLVESSLCRQDTACKMDITSKSSDTAHQSERPMVQALANPAAEAMGHIQPAFIILQPWISQPLVNMMQPMMLGHPGTSTQARALNSHTHWSTFPPNTMIMPPGAVSACCHSGAPSPSHPYQRTTTRPPRWKYTKRGAPMPAPPWDHDSLRAARELPGPGEYNPQLKPESSSFNIRITPDPEHPGYGAYTARSLPPRQQSKKKGTEMIKNPPR